MVEKKEITGFVLAGGKSLRMGSDKASVKLKNTAFLQKSIDALKPLVNNVVVVSDKIEHSNFGVSRIEDEIKDAGPLAGLHAALMNTQTEFNIILSCDVPLITSRIPELLIENIGNDFDVVQVESDGKTMPITALYHKRCLGKIVELLNSGERRMRFAVKTLKTKTITLNKSLSKQVTNVNTKKELKEIEHAIAD